MVKPHPRLLARNWQEVASVDCEAARGGAKSQWDSESFDDADGRHVEKLVKVCTDEEGVIRNLVHKPKSSYISLELAVAVRKQVHRMHLPDGQIGNLRPGVVSAERDFPIRGRVWAISHTISISPTSAPTPWVGRHPRNTANCAFARFVFAGAENASVDHTTLAS